MTKIKVIDDEEEEWGDLVACGTATLRIVPDLNVEGPENLLRPRCSDSLRK